MATVATTGRRISKTTHAPEPATPFFQPSIVDASGRLDHNRAPFIEGISAYRKQNMTSFATPGHKLGRGMDPELVGLYGADAFACDIPVSGGADGIHFDLDTWRLAEELGADAWNSDRTFYLVNGSSTGNLAFLTAQIRPGDKVIVARDVHKSLMVALIQSGAWPVYIAPVLPLLAQPAAWTVPLAFATMVVVSLLTPSRLPVHVSRTMVRLHTPEAVALDRGPQSL